MWIVRHECPFCQIFLAKTARKQISYDAVPVCPQTIARSLESPHPVELPGGPGFSPPAHSWKSWEKPVLACLSCMSGNLAGDICFSCIAKLHGNRRFEQCVHAPMRKKITFYWCFGRGWGGKTCGKAWKAGLGESGMYLRQGYGRVGCLSLAAILRRPGSTLPGHVGRSEGQVPKKTANCSGGRQSGALDDPVRGAAWKINTKTDEVGQRFRASAGKSSAAGQDGPGVGPGRGLRRRFSGRAFRAGTPGS